MIEATGAQEQAKDPAWLLTPQEAAERLKVTDRTVYTWTKRGLLPAFKIGLVVRYTVADLERFIEANKTARRTG